MLIAFGPGPPAGFPLAAGGFEADGFADGLAAGLLKLTPGLAAMAMIQSMIQPRLRSGNELIQTSNNNNN